MRGGRMLWLLIVGWPLLLSGPGRPVHGDESSASDASQAESRPASTHWAFSPPERPPLPRISNPRWARNAVDCFVHARLDRRGWPPGATADKETLIRRVSLDLTGLPPTLSEVDAFLADGSPSSYEQVVDRLLNSPHYGEHMARFWLDAVRYGDTHGLHLDNYREMWPYRDWVVQSFNQNLPYDRFVVEQLAGDLLPEATLSQQIATGFCRAHVTTNEGGSIEEEVYVRNVVDRVSTMGTVFMGLTLGCAVCHDHKFDPLTQKEFYQLFAFFNNLDGPELDGNVKDPAPVVSVPSDQQTAMLSRLRSQIAEMEERRLARKTANDPKRATWLDERKGKAGELDTELHLASGLVVYCSFEEGDTHRVVNHVAESPPGRIVGSVRRVEGRVGDGLELDQQTYVDLGNVASFDDDEPFSFGAWIRTSHGRNSVILAKTDPSQLYKGYDLSLLNGSVIVQISRRQPGYVVKVTTDNDLIDSQQWHHVFVTYDGSRRASGVMIYVDGVPRRTDVWSDALQFKDGIRNTQPLLLGRRDEESNFEGGRLDDVRVYARRLTDAEVLAVFLESHLATEPSEPSAEWKSRQQEALEHFYLLRHDGAFQKHTEQLELLRNQLRREELSVPTTLVFQESKTPRDAFVLIRGQYDQRGERVQRNTPAALPPLGAQRSRDRLGLAQWLVAAENPLTSRVAVNRFWQQVFGIGLVETSEDFGIQGSWPSHPELLDWLAVEFRESGWNVKALMKLIVMSATYRQSAYATPQLVQADPKNRLLARGPRFRLDAEMLRDQALFASGLLVPRLGGPSVKPPQPAGLWRAVGFSSSNTVEFLADTGPAKTCRRSLYTFWKRTAPPPAMNTFDAPSRESTCVRRERTNTPLQALLLLNDPQYVAASHALAARALRADVNTSAARAALIYRWCTARHAPETTIAELAQLANDLVVKYREDEASARKLCDWLPEGGDRTRDAPQLAAWTMVANLVLNLDEVVTKN